MAGVRGEGGEFFGKNGKERGSGGAAGAGGGPDFGLVRWDWVARDRLMMRSGPVSGCLG